MIEYREKMEAYFKMLYIKSYYQYINTPNGVNITIHQRHNVNIAEQELRDKYGIYYKNGKFVGKLGNVEAQLLFDNMSANPQVTIPEYKHELVTINPNDLVKPKKKRNKKD